MSWGGGAGEYFLQRMNRKDYARRYAQVAKAREGGDVYGVFSVQQSMDNKEGGVEREKEQGKDLSDEAAKAGVKHFVYTSVDFGGPDHHTGE